MSLLPCRPHPACPLLPSRASGAEAERAVFKMKPQDLSPLFTLVNSLGCKGIICSPPGPAYLHGSFALSLPEGGPYAPKNFNFAIVDVIFLFAQEGDEEVEGCPPSPSSNCPWFRDRDPSSPSPFPSFPSLLPPCSSLLKITSKAEPSRER